jgi:hypothetical protein
MKFIAKLLFAFALLSSGLASAQPAPPPSPWRVNGASIAPIDNSMGLLVPQNVTGGYKGPGTINTNGLYVNGLPVATSAGSVASFSAGATGLTPNTPTTGPVVLGGNLLPAFGGTGIASYAIGDLLYASGTTTLSRLADVGTGSALISGGVGIAPAWGKVPLGTLATEAANTVLGNGTAGIASPTALAMTSCSTSSSAVSWTANTGFGCNTAINAATVTTNANLTGPITSVGNVTSIASQTGTGSTFATSAGPTFSGTTGVATLNFSAAGVAPGTMGYWNGGGTLLAAQGGTAGYTWYNNAQTTPLMTLSDTGIVGLASSAAITNGNGTYFFENAGSSTNAVLVQHDGTSGRVSAQSGALNLGAGGSTWATIASTGGFSFTGAATFNGGAVLSAAQTITVPTSSTVPSIVVAPGYGVGFRNSSAFAIIGNSQERQEFGIGGDINTGGSIAGLYMNGTNAATANDTSVSRSAAGVVAIGTGGSGNAAGTAKAATFDGSSFLRANNATVIPSGGVANSGFLFSSTANFGTFFGSGPPTISAAQGSIYLRSDGVPYYNTNGTTGWTALGAAGTSVVRSYLAGLTLSTAGSSATFSVAAGSATDSTNVSTMALSSAYSKTTSAWALGTGVGSLDTGTIANNTWYHVFEIQRPDTGVVDVLISLSATAPTLPTNYTLFRRIGSMKTNGSAQWVAFYQVGDKFTIAPVANYSASGGIALTLQTFSVPIGAVVEPLFTVYLGGGGGGGTEVQFAPGNNVASYSSVKNVDNSVANAIVVGGPVLPTNTAAQLYIGVALWSGSPAGNITTYGWIDRRERDF